jgi:HlyD family secretion protein
VRSFRVSSWFAVAIVAALPLVSACGRKPAGDSSGAPELALVERRDMDVRAEAAGLLEPIRMVEVKSKASGEVLRIHVETGDEVKRGALLVEIDPRDVKNAFDQADADLEVARARASTAAAQKARVEELRNARVTTDQEYEAAALEDANARAQLVKARTNLDLARERMGDVTIRAPIDGTIISRTVEEGGIIASASQNVSGGTTLLLMANLAEMQVRALVDETDLGRIKPNQVAKVSVEAFADRTFEGLVLKIEPQAVVDQNVTMFPVLVRLDNRAGLLKPGMNADVVFEVARRTSVIAIPNAAVINVRDAEAAGAVLGLDAESVRNSLRMGGQLAMATPADGERQARDESDGDQRGAEGGEAGERERPAGAPPQLGDAAPALSGDCAAIMQRARQGGGFQALSEADRAKLRDCRPRPGGSGGRGPGSGEFGGAPRNQGNAEIRPAVVFVADTAGKVQARPVMLGLNDFDYSEVVNGLQAGERVVLISVARLQAQQQEFNARMRERASGAFTGQAPTRGGGRGR